MNTGNVWLEYAEVEEYLVPMMMEWYDGRTFGSYEALMDYYDSFYLKHPDYIPYMGRVAFHVRTNEKGRFYVENLIPKREE